MISIIKNSKKNNRDITTFLNPYSYLIARKNKDLFKNFNIKIDGILLVKALKISGINLKRESFDMTSLAPIIFNEAINYKKSIFLVGTTQENLEKSVKNIKNNFKGINIIGFRNGYFKSNERELFLNELKKINPDIVVCGMGSILQENFLLDLKNLGWKGVGYTCGGFLHQSSEFLFYYPKWIDKCNLRWLYRLYKEPDTRRRFLIYYPKFLFIFLYDFIFYLKTIKK